MKLVAATRVLDEEDIVEAFVRHTAVFVDHHVLLDNGSTDRTLEILRALHDEGVPITVLQNRSIVFAELQYNTLLYHTAATALQADWVLFLDADEFIDDRSCGDLRARLAAVNGDVRSIRVELVNYDAPTAATAHELAVPRKFVLRQAAGTGVWKVFVRGGADAGRVAVDAGNHQIFVGGNYLPSTQDPDIRLAHFPTRSAVHWAGKAALGWLKVLAAGAQVRAQGHNTHYTSSFERLKTGPEEMLLHAIAEDGTVPERPDLVCDPAPYRGGLLRYTHHVDQRWRMLRLLLGRMEQIATAYGDLLDNNPALREKAEADAFKIDVLIHPEPRGTDNQQER